MLELELIKTGIYTLKYNNKYIHSKYDPERESKKFIGSKLTLLKDDIILIYGAGLGYHVREVFNIINENEKKVYLFEFNEDLMNAFRLHNQDILKDKRLITISGANKRFINILKSVIYKVKDIIVHKASLNTIKDTNEELYNLFNNYEKDRMLINKYSLLLKENSIANLKVKSNEMSKLIEKKDSYKKKWILVSAGPSLDLEVDKLKKIRDNYNIISVGTAARTLVNNGIVPDLIVIIDGNEVVKEQLKGINHIDSTLCFLSTASRWAVAAYKGEKYIFFNDKNEDGIIIETGKTVAVAALNIAIKLGAEEIVFLGQDLAYINGRSHIKFFDEMYDKKNEIFINKNTPRILSVNGDYVYTNNGYIYFKEQIESVIKNNDNIRFINCSKGAIIRGCNTLDIDEIIRTNKLV